MNRRFRWSLAVAALLWGAATPLVAQLKQDHARVAQALELLEVWLDAQRDYNQIPGISAAVVHDQQVVWKGGFGYADLDRKVPATAETIYSICSISKLFTSVAVMQLRDAGRLRLDDPLSKHLSWFSIHGAKPEEGPVTVEGILTHAAGLPRESDHSYWTGPEFPFPTSEEVRERIAGQEMLYPPETWFQYSNLGLTLAGEVVASASGTPYPEYVTRNILEPLGLASTTPEMPTTERGKRLATGYGVLTREGTRAPVPFFQARGIAPAAGFASTALDLARFASWQFRELAAKRGEILRAATLREMHRIHWVDPDFETLWGLGFSVWRSGDKTFVGHGGSCPGYRTQLLLRPEERIATVFMANAGGVNTGLYTQRMYAIVAPAIQAALKDSVGKAPPPPPPPDSSLRAYVGIYGTQPWGAERAVVVWEDGLAAVGLPTMDPLADLTKLRKVGEHTFRRVRKDGSLAEPIVFEMGTDGRAARMRWHQNYSPRVK